MKYWNWVFLVALFGAACTEDASNTTQETGQDSGTASAAEPEDTTDQTASGSEPVFVEPPAGCEPPSALPQDPLSRILDTAGPGGRRHLVNLAHDSERGLVFACGTPGIEVYEHSGNSLALLGDTRGKKEHLAVVNSTTLAATSRGRSPRDGTELTGMGLYLFDTSTPSNLSQINYTEFDDASGLAVRGSILYMLSHDGKLRTFDVSQPSNPELLHTLEGLGNPWELLLVNEYAYIADNSLGLVTVSLENPEAPVIASIASSSGGPQDLALGNDVVFLAIGSAGIQAFSISDPAAPVSISTLELGGAVISVSTVSNLLWATNQESVLVVDISDPSAPVQLAIEDTPSWAMHVESLGNTALVADWKSMSIFEYEAGIVAPEANTSRSDVYFTGGSLMQQLTLKNRGGSELTIAGMAIDDSRFTVQVDRLSVSPGDKATIQIFFEDDGQPVNTSLCIATNDPDTPVEQVGVASTSSSGSSVLIGEPAPNFNLPGLDGQYYELNRQLGSPVVLSYFATW